MILISATEAKAKLTKYINLAALGETVCITRRGKIMARIVAAEAPRQPIDFVTIRAMTENMTLQTESAGEFIRRMRDGDRY